MAIKGLFSRLMGRNAANYVTAIEARKIAESVVREAVEAEATQTGNDGVDAVIAEIRAMRTELQRAAEGEMTNTGGGGFGQITGIITLFERYNLDQAASFAATQCRTAAKGPIDPLVTAAETPIGGVGYNPGTANPSLPATVQTNGRILAWGVNQIVNVSRATLTFFAYMMILLKWEIIDLFVGEDGVGSDAFGLEDLFILGAIAAVNTTPAQGTQGLQSIFSNIFSPPPGDALYSAAPYYQVV